MKRLILFILSAILLCVLLLSAVGCFDSETENPAETTASGEEVTTGEVTTGEGTHTHAFGEWTTVIEATCTAEGEKERVCACGEKETKKIFMTQHNFVNNVCTACGQRESSEGLEYTDDGNGGYRVSGIGTCTDLDIVIPREYNDKPVTSIGEYAFYLCESLTSIIIPDSVTSIGDCAFSKCSSLTSITIPDSVTSIGSSAFYDTAYYNNNANWTYGVLYIGNHLIKAKSDSISGAYTIKDGTKCIAGFAFFECSSLTSITIPDSVINIGKDAFSGCGRLTSITVAEGNPAYHSSGNCLIETETKVLIVGCQNSIIPTDGSVTSIGNIAFSGCSSLTSITIPDSVTSIGNIAFSGCSKLTSITIPDSVTSIGSSAFYDTAYYNNNANWTDGVLYIGNHLIKAKSDSISGVYTIKDETKCIAGFAFSGCSSLTSITIPDSVTSIGDYAFWRCSSLTSITISGSVTSIGDSAFCQCSSLTSITFSGTKAQWDAIFKGSYWDYDTGSYTVHCTDGDIKQ